MDDVLRVERITDNGAKEARLLALQSQAVFTEPPRSGQTPPNPKGERTSTTCWRTHADVGPFQESILLQELIVAHCKFLPPPTVQGNLMSRADRCALKEIAGCESQKLLPAAAITHFRPGEVIVSGGAATIVDKAKHGGTTVTLLIMKVMVRCLRLPRN